MSSQTQKFRDYLSNLLDSDDSRFNATLKSSDIHHYLFSELSISPLLIYQIIESFLTEYQPSPENTSYYIHHEARFKLFLLLSHLLNNNDSVYTNQCQKLRDIVAPKLHSFIFKDVFPCKSGIIVLYPCTHSIVVCYLYISYSGTIPI